jgi:hypothetical protein
MYCTLSAAGVASLILSLPVVGRAQTAEPTPPAPATPAAPPAPAAAPPAQRTPGGTAAPLGDDEVKLKDGTTLRGTVVRVVPNQEIVIVLGGTGEERHIPRAEVERAIRGKYVKPAEDVPPAPSPPVSPPGPASSGNEPKAPNEPDESIELSKEPKLGAPGVVRVHIDSPVPVMLGRRLLVVERVGKVEVTGAHWKFDAVCKSPCDQILYGDGVWTLGTAERGGGEVGVIAAEREGAKYPAPSPFTFKGMSGEVTLHVKPGSHARDNAGWALAFSSFGLLIGGGLFLGIEATNKGGPASCYSCVAPSGPSPADIGVPLGVMMGGLAMAGVGVALAVTSRTKVTLDQHPPHLSSQWINVGPGSLAFKF